jgi:hypothetical protein
MDNSVSNITSTTAPITLQPGEFRIFGNYVGSLSTVDVNAENKLSLQIADNPVKNGLAKLIYHKAKNGEIFIYDMSGKKMDSFKLNNEKRNLRIKNKLSGRNVFGSFKIRYGNFDSENDGKITCG